LILAIDSVGMVKKPLTRQSHISISNAIRRYCYSLNGREADLALGRGSEMARREAPIQVRLNAPAVWEYMARQNLSQNELARRLGITSGYLSQLVNGQRCPSASLRRRLLELLAGARFEDLFIVERRNHAGKRSADESADRSTRRYRRDGGNKVQEHL
jgi:transcriptional regulator with XRE-family HTH domain